MGNQEWGMGNGEWGMENGEWGTGNGKWRVPQVPSSTKNDQVDSDINNLGESNMIKEKVIKNL